VTVHIAVYSPAKNEEHNVRNWYESAKDADEVVLVDTGSTDKTLSTAYNLERRDDTWNFRVEHAVVTPWRFDDGFNAALSQVSADIDIAVPLHLDERLQPGWRKELEKAWEAGGRQFTFAYEWGEGLTFRHDRIHARHGFRWVGAAHEYPSGPGPKADTDVRIVQERDQSKDRSQDDGLIELAWRENPTARTTYYWARQCAYNNRWDEARTLFQEYLGRSDALYDQERAEACRWMARMVYPQYKESWLLRACSEAPQRRECWTDLMRFYASNGMQGEAVGALTRALKIQTQDPNNSFHLEADAWNDNALHHELIPS
jgi:glycosyltransferase involved in cell wall biosynthesis